MSKSSCSSDDKQTPNNANSDDQNTTVRRLCNLTQGEIDILCNDPIQGQKQIELNNTCARTSTDKGKPYVNDNAILCNLVRTNWTLGSRPCVSSTTKRLKLSRAIEAIVVQWSLQFIDTANQNDDMSCFVVSQMYCSKKGYGSVKYNLDKGKDYLFKAIKLGNLDARVTARKLFPKEWTLYLQEEGIDEIANELKELQMKDSIESKIQ